MKTGAAALALVPSRLPSFKTPKRESLVRPAGAPVKRVALLLGCVQEVLEPSINQAAIRLLRRHGVEVVMPSEEACCGALQHQLGRENEAHKAARRNVDAWSSALREGPLDAILTTASGCGTMVKDYGHLLARDRGYAERATDMSRIARDITRVHLRLGLLPPLAWTSLRVAYHSACSLEHGQQVGNEPRSLLIQAGFTVLDVPEGHICCGSAGTYNHPPARARRPIARPQAQQHREREARLDRHRQYRLHHAASARQRRSRGAHRRAARLGDRRPMPQAAGEAQSQGAPDREPAWSSPAPVNGLPRAAVAC